MGICQVSTHQRANGHGFGSSITISSFSTDNIWGDFSDKGSILVDEQITRIKKELQILELVKEAYIKAKLILNQNYDKLILFSELLMNNTIIMSSDLDGIDL
jgi:hypothetical protein